MAGKRTDWDFALRIRGVTPRTLPMARLADYLKAWAVLLGDGNEPQFAGIVKGSAVLRASLPADSRLTTKVRLLSANAGTDESAVKSAAAIAEMMGRDRVHGEVQDRTGAVILEFRPRERVALPEYVMHDTAVVDGVVISLVGADDTVHLRLQDSDGSVFKVTVRSLETARNLAQHFRGEVLRAYVHGTWTRTAEGSWQPNSLYLDRFDVLDDEPASAILSRLSALPGNRWATMESPDQLLRQLRGDA